MTEYPIQAALPHITASLATKRIVVLTAPTGSGKTTIAPLALLNEPWLNGQTILILEPRRLAARLAAERMAALLAEPVGQTVGYRIRFEQKISPGTKIEVLTEGILTRRLQNDPFLTGVGLVIFDEFHERSIYTDLTLALCLDAQAGLREDLRLLIMSATLDVAKLVELLPEATMVSAAGRTYPVTVRYQNLPKRGQAGHPTATCYDARLVTAAVASTIKQAADVEAGDILAFLPGGREIRDTMKQLSAWSLEQKIRIDPLYADLPKNLQDRAVQPPAGSKRRVILATSIAETSLTIEGIGVVVDSGWMRVPRFDPNSGLTRLTTVRVSQATAMQRAGRAGRTGPGVCYRLMPEAFFATLLAQTPPEIENADLAPLLIDLANWGVDDPKKLFWLDPPPAGNLAQAKESLINLEALDHTGQITAVGRKLGQLPLHPRLGRLLLYAAEHGQLQLGTDLAALLSERDILGNIHPHPADIGLRLQAMNAFRHHDKAILTGLGADPTACARVDRASRQYLNLIQTLPSLNGTFFSTPLRRVSTLTKKYSAQNTQDIFSQVLNTETVQLENAGKKQKTECHAAPADLLLLAFPERVAQLRPGSRNRYLLASGRGARLAEGDGLCDSPYLIVPELDAGETEGCIYLAADMCLASLREQHSRLINTTTEILWDKNTETVVARKEESFFKLTLSSRQLTSPDCNAVRLAMLDGIRQLGIPALPWTREARILQDRIICLREWQPEANWPTLTDSHLLVTLSDWLGPFLGGISSRADLVKLDLLTILRSLLTWLQTQQLDQDAPTHFTAPSGSRVRINYAPGQQPVLAIRLQEMFGLADTPRLCQGRIPVLLHLLSPAQRPVQITQDLKGFWNTTYREVRKELMGRYPKHHWPEDPWTASPTARVKRTTNKS